MKTSDLKRILLKLDGERCYECIFPRTPLEIHHAIIHRNKKYMDVLNHPVNTVLLCRDCHSSGIPNGHQWRVQLLHSRIKKLGIECVRGWYESLPDKLKLHSDNKWIGLEMEEK